MDERESIGGAVVHPTDGIHARGRCFITIVAVLLVLGPGKAHAQRLLPDSVLIETGDVTRFLGALNALSSASTPRDSAAVLFQHYYYPASPGLLDFIRSRIGSVYNLLEKIRTRPVYYSHLRQSLAGVGLAGPAIREAFRSFEALYPDAVFADIYLVVGRMTSGGTVSPGRILIGTEMYGRDASASTHELSEWESAVVRDAGILDAIVVHELMHINQPALRSEATLLQQALREGGPDFITELVTGRNISNHIHEWARTREAELWQEFQIRMNGTDYKGWIYDTSAADRPADLGYWIGYQIARAYYDRADDKRQALGDILGSSANAEEFLRKSGYDGPSRR